MTRKKIIASFCRFSSCHNLSPLPLYIRHDPSKLGWRNWRGIDRKIIFTLSQRRVVYFLYFFQYSYHKFYPNCSNIILPCIGLTPSSWKWGWLSPVCSIVCLERKPWEFLWVSLILIKSVTTYPTFPLFLVWTFLWHD